MADETNSQSSNSFRSLSSEGWVIVCDVKDEHCVGDDKTGVGVMTADVGRGGGRDGGGDGGTGSGMGATRGVEQDGEGWWSCAARGGAE